MKKQLSNCCKAWIRLTGEERPRAFACVKCGRIIGTPEHSKEDLYKLATSKKVIQKAAEESACIMRIEKRLYDIETQALLRGKGNLDMQLIAEEIFEDVKETINKSK